MFDRKIDQNCMRLSKGLKSALRKIKLMPELVALDEKLLKANERLKKVDLALNDGEYCSRYFAPGKPADEGAAAEQYLATGVLPDASVASIDVLREGLYGQRRVLARSIALLENQRRNAERNSIHAECQRLMPQITRELLAPALAAATECVERFEAMRELFFALSHHGMGEAKRPMILQGTAPGYRALNELKTYVRIQNELIEKGVK